ncbi:MAG: CPBP family intramembrane metalloprotease [Deltaproteobacteria bacterium]|nr:MAG: CPBP family intramembrane metalloprotease [Deltaproteobacteria bacterium]
MSSPLPLRSLVWFLGPTFALPWVVLSPYLLGLREPSGLVFLALQAGLLAWPALVALGVLSRRERVEGALISLGLCSGRWKRVFAYSGIALVLPIFAAMSSLFLAEILGWYALDLTALSGYRQTFAELVEADALRLAMKPWWLRPAIFASVILGSLVYAGLSLGEELGWRGWLLPRLRGFGVGPALTISALVGTVWHAPMIWLSPMSPHAPALSVLVFVVFGTLWGVWLGWVRLVSESLWPVLLSRGALAASAGLVGTLHLEGTEPDLLWVGLRGVTGWLLPGLTLAFLAGTGALFKVPGTPPPEEGPLSSP